MSSREKSPETRRLLPVRLEEPFARGHRQQRVQRSAQQEATKRDFKVSNYITLYRPTRNYFKPKW